MIVLGIDPGTSHVGWAVLRDGRYHTSGSFSITGGTPWPQKLRQLRPYLERLFAEHQPDCVAVEATQVHEGLWEQAKSDPDVLARLRSQARLTRQTEELAGAVLELAGRGGAITARPTDTQGLHALGLKRGATDRQASEVANMLFGTRLLVKDHHEARAIGIALAGEKQAHLGKVLPREAPALGTQDTQAHEEGPGRATPLPGENWRLECATAKGDGGA